MKTKYLWIELAELSPHRDEFVAEVKEKTSSDVKAILDELAKAGHLRYSVEPAYKMVTDGSPVLNIWVSHITTQLKNLARQLKPTVLLESLETMQVRRSRPPIATANQRWIWTSEAESGPDVSGG